MNQLPTFEQIERKIYRNENLSALEAFIYQNEPVDGDDFREGLTAVITEILMDS